MWQTFKFKLFDNKKVFYIGVLAIVGIVVLIYALISFNGNKSSVYNGPLTVSSPQIYISDFDKLQPGVNDPNVPKIGEEKTGALQLDILTVNETKEADVSLQYVATLYAKTINAIPTEKIDSGEYLDASKLYISDIGGKEIVDKYYVLDNKTTVLAKNYAETDGNVIAVRYYLSSDSLPAAIGAGTNYLVNSYLVGLDSYAPAYYVTDAEVCITIITQATAREVELAEWTSVDNKVIFSTDDAGTPIDTSDLFRSDDTLSSSNDEPLRVENTPVVAETTVPVSEPVAEETTAVVTTDPVDEPAPVETAVPNVTEAEATTTTTQPETTTAEETTTAPSETQQSETTTTTADSRVFPESMSINTGSVNLNIGDTYSFSVTFEPSNATETALTWSSDNTGVASVSPSGVVTANAAGRAAITVQSVNGMSLTAYVNVTAPAETATPVTEPVAAEPDPEPVNVILNTSSVSLSVGSSYQLSADVYPLDMTFAAVTWSSSNDSVVQVGSSGLVYANSAGTAVIAATTSNGITAECTITVQ